MKKQQSKAITLLGVIALIVVASVLVVTTNIKNAHAADTAGLLSKWYYTLYYTCMGSSNVESTIEPVPENGNIIDKVFKKSGDMYYPSYNLAGKEKDNCREIAKTRVLSAYASSTWSSASTAQSFMENKLKYEVKMTEGESEFNIVAKTRIHYTNYYIGCNWFGANNCESDYDGESRSVRIKSKMNDDGTRNYSYEDGFANHFDSLKVELSNGNLTLKHNTTWLTALVGRVCTGGSESKTFPLKVNIREFYNDVTNGLENISWSDFCTTTSGDGMGGISTTTTEDTTYTFTTDGDSLIVDSSEATGYTKKSTSAKDSVDALATGGLEGIKFNETDFYILYDYYLNKLIDASGATANKKTCNPSNTANLTQVKLYDNESSSFKDCYVNLNGKDASSVTVYTQNPATPVITTTTMSAVINWFNTVDTSKIDTSKIDGVNKTEDPEEGGDGDTTKEPSCFDNAGSLGWIVCPMIDWFSNFIQGAYEALVVPFMVLDAGLFTNDAAQNVWEVFRNFANTAFIILFLVVIFSQLTGVGIDNYGIKKILPKLFVTAVLVNLSYIICQLAVDVSNIIGKSIGDLLSLDAGEFSMSEVPDAKVNLGAGAIVVQVIAGVLALGIVLTKGVAIIVPVLMGLLSIAIAIFFLFVLLAVRKAFALILVIVSPMAFVCYALPNTKKIFDRWFNTFKGLLLAFPVCSAMVYGGQFAAKIVLMSAAGCSTSAKGCGGAVAFSLILTAAVISIVPIFLIPKALQASMSAIAMGIARAHHGTAGYLRGKAGRRLNESRLNNRARYREQMRGAKNAARQGEYNARRGQRYLTKQQERGNADLTKMTPTQRAAYLNAQGQVDARDKAIQSAWSTRFSELSGGDEARVKELQNLANSGKLDKNSLIAGLGSIKDADKLTAAFNSVRNSEAGRELLSDAKVRSSVADTMKSGDGIINQSMGKVLGRMDDNEFRSTDDAGFKKQVAAKVQGAGTGVMASQNKDVFATDDAASYFSSKQLAAGVGANYSGDTEKSFNSMLAGTSAQTKQETAAELSATNISNMSASSMNSLAYTDENGQSVSGADVVKNGAADAINTLNSEDGARLRANMDSSVKNALGITGEGGGSTGNAGGSTSTGGGDSGGAPAPTNDDSAAYQAKLEEMSQRQAAQDGSGSIDIPHEDVGPMRGDHGRGINDATGKERSAEGNRFDYHPKQSGESNADYSARSSWEKHIADLSEQHPLKPGESTSDWMKRVGAPTQAEWKASHGSDS